MKTNNIILKATAFVLLAIGLASCSVEEETDIYDNNTNPPLTEADYRNINYYAPPILTATIDGENVVVCDTNPPFSGSSESIGGITSTYSGYYQSTGSWNWHTYGTTATNTNDSRAFTLNTGIIAYPFNSFGSNIIPTATFFGFFKTGLNDFSYNTTAISATQGTNLNTYKVTLSYKDEAGVLWNSYNGDQTGSTFQITDTIRYKNYGFFNDLKVKYKAKFNCKLYNANGDSKTLTNGLFIGEFWTDI